MARGQGRLARRVVDRRPPRRRTMSGPKKRVKVAGKQRKRKKKPKGPAPSRGKQRRKREEIPSFKPGDEIARCKVLGVLGAGTTGQVVLAEQPVIGRKVAVKILSGTEPERVARFHDEARKLARLDHPNIVELHDVGEHEGRPYIMLEYVEGRSLAELASRGEGLSIPVLLRIAATVAVPSPRKGQTLLLHVERRDADLKGKFREYEILAYVGGGSYGEVYRARERLSGRDVALKVLRREWVSDQAAVARFRREAMLLTRVSHPNVVRMYNFGRYGASFFIAMDFLEGPTLDDIVEERERMEFGEAVGMARQVLSGLSAIHEAGVFHRDVKPTNVMLVDDRVVLCDFGMATALDAGKLTTTGLVLGSPSYMSPEQAVGEPVTSASDVYSAGVVLYEMISGRLPHEERTTREILRSIVKEPPVPVSEWRSGVPRALADALDRMLAKEPEERPTAAEAMEMLAAGVG